MELLALSGSRNREGRTAQAINAIRQGVSRAGGNSECIFLTELAIEHCRQCESDGWGICHDGQQCIIDDDFASLVTKIGASDAIVLATPVYFGDMSESMRTFLERFSRINFSRQINPPKLRAPGWLPGMPPQFPESKTAVGLCVAGGGGRGAPACCASLDQIMERCGFDTIDMIPLRRQNLEVKLPLLEIIGEWLVTKPTSGPPAFPSLT